MLPALRAAAFGMGVGANILSAWISFNEAEKLREKGYGELEWPMFRSGITFMLGAVPLALVAIDFALQASIRAGFISSSNMIARSVAKATAARLGAAVVGLSVPGIGWLLTIVAVGDTVYVVMNISGPMQHWLSGCYFGTTKWWKINVPKRTSWEEEEKAFKQVVSDTDKTPGASPGAEHA